MQFEPLEQWIWLPKNRYPNNQTTAYSCMLNDVERNYTVVHCERSYDFGKPIEYVDIRTSGDTFFRLYVNGEHTVTGPASVGGDFLSNERARPQYYATEYRLGKEHPELSKGQLSFCAIIRMQSVRMFEYSMGHGGFYLTAHLRFADGTKTVVATDESWMIRLLSGHTKPGYYDGSIKSDEKVNAQRVANIWHCLTSPLPTAQEALISPQGNKISVPAGKTVDVTLQMERIYTGYP